MIARARRAQATGVLDSMLRSMTGYGNVHLDTARFAAEIGLRSVNHRYLKITTKIADELVAYQGPMEEVVRARVTRGAVYLNVYLDRKDQTELYDIDGALLRKYIRQLRRLGRRLDVDGGVGIRDVLALPGIARVRDAIPLRSKKEWATLRAGLERALDRLDASRTREGRAIERSLRRSLRKIRTSLGVVGRGAARVPRLYRDRLRQRINQLLPDGIPGVEGADLLREVAIYADRADVTEEIERLDAHVRAFDETLVRGGAVGRELEFLTQEMFRETNTMAVKCGTLRLAGKILAMKSEVDRLKEQVQNVE